MNQQDKRIILGMFELITKGIISLMNHSTSLEVEEEFKKDIETFRYNDSVKSWLES